MVEQRQDVDAELCRAISVGLRERDLLPLVGIENEFYVYCNNRHIDFRALLHRLTRYEEAGPSFVHRQGCFLRSGSLLSADGSCAEMATPPFPMDAEGLQAVSETVLRNRDHLVGLIQRLAADLGGEWRLEGYSSHFNFQSPTARSATMCQLLARTVLPAYMMLTERPISGGVMLRPRRGRVEICGEYQADGAYQRAVLAFMVGSYRALASRLVEERLGELPFMVRSGPVRRAKVRRGITYPPRSYGGLLYRQGRSAPLRVLTGEGVSTMSAQDLLSRWTSFSAAEIASLGSAEDRSLLRRIVEGQCELSIENHRPDPRYYDVHSTGETSPPQGLARLYGQAVEQQCRGGLYVDAGRMSWHGITFRLWNGAASVQAYVRREHLRAFDELIEDGTVRRLVDRFIAGDGRVSRGSPRVGRPETGFYSASLPKAPVSDALLSPGGEGDVVAPPSAQLPKKPPPKPPKKPPPKPPPKPPKKKRKEATCSVELLVEETQFSSPVVEICVPATRDGLVPTKDQEPPVNSSIDPNGVFLHNGGFGHDQLDLSVKAIGFDFAFHRYYRSFIDYDGILGRGWEHQYNQRAVPTRPEEARTTDLGWCEIYEGPEASKSGDLWFYNGYGRRTFHSCESWHHRTVKKCGPAGIAEFKAIVTSYVLNPGERSHIQRYAVYDGKSLWGDPIYYVRRNHDGSEQILNCHGYVIAIRDINGNTMRFGYGLPINPATRYKVLRTITDTTGREYSLDYANRAGALRIIKLTDPFGREVEFSYNGRGELAEVIAPGGQHSENRRKYLYDGRPGRLEAVIAPREARQAAGSRHPHLRNTYNANDQVVKQRVGTPDSVTPKAGGDLVFEYEGPWVKKITDRAGDVHRYVFEEERDTRVLKQQIIENRTLTVPGFQFSQPASFTTTWTHDDEFRVTLIERPGGSKLKMTYEPSSSSVLQGDERDWVERNVTWTDNLANGNLIERRMISSRAGEADRVETWRYDPLFNRPREETTPKGTTTSRYRNGFCATPFDNGNAYEVIHPAALNPDGTTQVVRETFVYGLGGLVAEHVDVDGTKVVYNYDNAGSVTLLSIDPDNLALATEYVTNDLGLMTHRKFPDGQRTAFDYDDRDNVVKITDHLGHEVRHFYDENDSTIRIEHDVVDDRADFTYATESARIEKVAYEHDILGTTRAMIDDPDNLNLRTEFDQDGEGRLTAHRSPRATGSSPEEPRSTVEMTYDARGLKFARTAAKGHPDETSTYWIHDESANVQFAIDAVGGVTSYLHNGFDEPIQVRSPVGVVSVIQRNDAGQPTRISRLGHPGGPSPQNRTGSTNILLSDTIMVPDAYDRVVKWSQQAFDTASGIVAGFQRLISKQWHSPGGVPRIFEDAAGRRTVHRYDSAARLEAVVIPGGHETALEYDRGSHVELQKQVDREEGLSILPGRSELTMKIKRTFDGLGRVASETVPGAGTTRFAYDSRDRIRAVKKETGAVHHFIYDTAHRNTHQLLSLQANSFNPSGQIKLVIDHDRNGNVRKRKDGLDQTTEYVYDPLDRLREIVDPDGRRTTAELNGNGLPILVTSRANEQWRTTYDAASRVQESRHVNASGFRLIQTFEYDGNDRLTRVTDNSDPSAVPGNEQSSDVRMTYNSVGWLTAQKQDGASIGYDYDPTGVCIKKRYPSGKTIDMDLTDSGKVETVSRQGFRLADYGYLGGRMQERAVASALFDPSRNLLFPFPLVEKTYFNAVGQMRGFAHFVHDEITDPSAPQDIFLFRFGTMEYDTSGRLIKKIRPDSTTIYEYDHVDRLTRTVVDPNDRPSVLREGAITEYDAANNARKKDTVTRSASGTDRLVTTETTPNVLGGQDSKTTRVDSGPAQTSTNQYDHNGSLSSSKFVVDRASPALPDLPATRRLFYDATGRLMTVFIETDDPGEANYRIFYKYDALDRRIERVEQRVRGIANQVLSEFQTRYVFDADRCIEEWTRNGETDPWSTTRTYIHGPRHSEIIALDVNETVIGADIDNDGRSDSDLTLVYLQDHERTPLALARLIENGTRYHPVYERYFTDSAGNTERFELGAQGLVGILRTNTGQEVDHQARWFHSLEGLHYNGRRFYDPQIGQFVSRDPEGAWTDPSAFGNSYSYAGENPVMNTDLGGFISWPILPELRSYLTRRVDLGTQGHPTRHGMAPTDPHAKLSIAQHALASHTTRLSRPSPYISASRNQFGPAMPDPESPRKFKPYRGTLFFIDERAFVEAGGKIHSTEAIIAKMAEEGIAASRRAMYRDAQYRPGLRRSVAGLLRTDTAPLLQTFRGLELETLMEGRVQPAMVRTPHYVWGARIAHGGGKALTVVGAVMTASDLIGAGVKSYDKGSPAPLGAEVIRQGAAWGGAVIGAKLGILAGIKVGFVAGATVGSATGPGAIITAIGGAIIGGIVGYTAGDVIADQIDEN